MKICSKCNEEKPEGEFPWKKKDVRRASWCKECQKAYAKNHHANNKQYYIDKAKRNNPKYIAENKRFIVEYLLTHPCVDCGENDIEVLEFDHVIPLKNHSARRVTNLMSSRSALILEIEKCEVRCANCHVRRTRRMAGTLRMAW